MVLTASNTLCFDYDEDHDHGEFEQIKTGLESTSASL